MCRAAAKCCVGERPTRVRAMHRGKNWHAAHAPLSPSLPRSAWLTHLRGAGPRCRSPLLLRSRRFLPHRATAALHAPGVRPERPGCQRAAPLRQRGRNDRECTARTSRWLPRWGRTGCRGCHTCHVTPTERHPLSAVEECSARRWGVLGTASGCTGLGARPLNQVTWSRVGHMVVTGQSHGSYMAVNAPLC